MTGELQHASVSSMSPLVMDRLEAEYEEDGPNYTSTLFQTGKKLDSSIRPIR